MIRLDSQGDGAKLQAVPLLLPGVISAVYDFSYRVILCFSYTTVKGS